MMRLKLLFVFLLLFSVVFFSISSLSYAVEKETEEVEQVETQNLEELKTVSTVIDNEVPIIEEKTLDSENLVENKENLDNNTEKENSSVDNSSLPPDTDSEVNLPKETQVIEEEGSNAIKEEISTQNVISMEKSLVAPINNLEPSVNYITHVQNDGWLPMVSNGEIGGTVGQSKSVEAIQIFLQNAPYSGGVNYKTHVQDIGWLGDVPEGETSGTVGRNKQVEAIQISLTGQMSNYYDIYYRVHTQDFGWLDWAKNGEPAGSEGLSKHIEAVKILLVKKGDKAPGSLSKPFLTRPSVTYSSHVQTYGWLKDVVDGGLSGTEGQGKQIEAIKLELLNTPYNGGITYSTHIENNGWLNHVSNGDISGTIGESKRVEAIKIDLTGDIKNYYDVYYRAHIQDFGWLGWTKNGDKAGSEGLGKQIEAIEVILVEKGKTPPESTNKSFVTTTPSVLYSSHVETYGWMDYVQDGNLSGTEGEVKRIEAVKIELKDSPYSGDIVYSTHVQDYGWLNEVANGAVSGTSGQGKRVEAIKIVLTGELADHYDVYYRVHMAEVGWLGWTKNGMKAGSEGLVKQLEAIEVKLIEKGSTPPGPTDRSFVTTPSVTYSSHVETYGWMDYVQDGNLSGTLGKAKRLEAIKIELKDSPFSGDIVYSTHVQDYGWLSDVSNGEISGTSGQGKRVEAIKIHLTGQLARLFDVYYRVHIEQNGWLGWAKNGDKAGSERLLKRIEAVEVMLVPKGKSGPVSGKKSFIKPFTVFIDPGHGGSDPGAISGGYHEADLNFAVAKKVQSLLSNKKFNVYMSRNSDTYVSLLDRSRMANATDADIFVSIHHNNAGSTSANGIESYYYEYDSDYQPKINAEMHNDAGRIERSVTLTNLIQEQMIDHTNANDRGTDGAAYSVIRETAIPATLLELGFISNSSERQKLITDSYQNKLATAIVNGIVKYFEIYY